MNAAVALSKPVITDAHRAMARRIALGFRRQLPPNVLTEDLVQAALLGLWDGLQKSASRGYDPDEQEWYLRTRIRGAILDELRTQDWLQRRLRRVEREGRAEVRVVHGADTSGAQRWEDTIASPEPGVDERLDEDWLAETAIQSLGDSARGQRERRLIRQHYYHGHKFKEIGDELGVSEPRVSQLHTRAILKMRAALKEEHESRASHRRIGSPAAQDRPAEPVAGGVPGSGLARPPAAAAARLVPGGARGPELGGAAREELRGPRPPARDAGALAGADGGLAMNGAVTEAVPSVLPEEGLDLAAEIERYRAWMVDQAMARCNGSAARAARLLGFASPTAIQTYLDRRAKGRGFRRGGAAHGDVARAPVPVAPAEPAPAPALAMEAKLAELAKRVPWTRVAELREEGLSDGQICMRLAGQLSVNRFLLEKSLKRRRAAEQQSAPGGSTP